MIPFSSRFTGRQGPVAAAMSLLLVAVLWIPTLGVNSPVRAEPAPVAIVAPAMVAPVLM